MLAAPGPMSFERMVRATAVTPTVVLAPVLVPLAGVLLLVQHGTLRLLALVPLLALWVATILHRALKPQAGWDACTAALLVNNQRVRDLAQLQEALAHELGNPLAAIKGLAALIELDPCKANERIDVLKGEIRRMESILEEHVTFARPLTPLRVAPVRVGEIIDSVVELHEGLARQHNVRLTAKNAIGTVSWDASKVKQVLISLLHNAIEASPEGGEVEVRVARNDREIVVGISDEGPGIAMNEMDRFFQPGYTTKIDGTGLGLSLARSLAEQHGGTLALRNRAEGGLEAALTLPLVSA